MTDAYKKLIAQGIEVRKAADLCKWALGDLALIVAPILPGEEPEDETE